MKDCEKNTTAISIYTEVEYLETASGVYQVMLVAPASRHFPRKRVLP